MVRVSVDSAFLFIILYFGVKSLLVGWGAFFIFFVFSCGGKLVVLISVFSVVVLFRFWRFGVFGGGVGGIRRLVLCRLVIVRIILVIGIFGFSVRFR